MSTNPTEALRISSLGPSMRTLPIAGMIISKQGESRVQNRLEQYARRRYRNRISLVRCKRSLQASRTGNARSRKISRQHIEAGCSFIWLEHPNIYSSIWHNNKRKYQVWIANPYGLHNISYLLLSRILPRLSYCSQQIVETGRNFSQIYNSSDKRRFKCKNRNQLFNFSVTNNTRRNIREREGCSGNVRQYSGRVVFFPSFTCRRHCNRSHYKICYLSFFVVGRGGVGFRESFLTSCLEVIDVGRLSCTKPRRVVSNLNGLAFPPVGVLFFLSFINFPIDSVSAFIVKIEEAEYKFHLCMPAVHHG